MNREKPRRGHSPERDCFPEVFLNATGASEVSNARELRQRGQLTIGKTKSRKRKNYVEPVEVRL